MSENTSTATPNRSAYRFWKGFSGFWKFLLTVVAGFGTVLGLWQWYVSKNSEPHLRLSVIDNQCLTQIEKAPKLECNLSYDGRKIKNLWASKIRIVNDCRKNIIGLIGGHLMSSNVSFTVAENFSVIAMECESEELDLDANCNKAGFSLAFKKWKPQQSCTLRIYSEDLGERVGIKGPSFRTAFDPFTQGDIKIDDYQELSPQKSLIRYLPVGWSVIIIWIGIVVNGIIFSVCVWGLVYKMGWIKMIRRLVWNRKYLMKVMDLVQPLNSKSNSNSKSIETLPKEFWKENNIPPPPARSPLVSGLVINRSELIPPLVICGIFILLSGISLMSLISM